jgi:hypothetical protein
LPGGKSSGLRTASGFGISDYFALEGQQIAGLAFQYFAQLLERAESDGAGSARVEYRKVLRRDSDALGDRIQLELSPGEHDVEVHYDGHLR